MSRKASRMRDGTGTCTVRVQYKTHTKVAIEIRKLRTDRQVIQTDRHTGQASVCTDLSFV